ncbi:cilia- and flagella-associated protein 100-like [Lycorma delicatula]|uniref:cilia- and flagella-associated protein 100-like n=1 Tax=Lycorma delicatula TaxID=130591 RepID=UPI003F515EE0
MANLQASTSSGMQTSEIKKRKVKIQRPKILDQLFHQTRQKRSLYYFTTGRKINNKKLEIYKTKEKQKDNPFILPVIDNLLKKRAVEKELKYEEKKIDRVKRVYDKHTYKTRQMLNIPERLHVPVKEEEILTEGIVDIDKQFFTIIKGRPLKEKKFDIKKYVNNVKDGLLSRLKIGFIYDEIYLLERQQTVETETIEEIKLKLQEYSGSFDEFLAKDNDRSMTLLREASEEANKTDLKKEELNAHLKKFIKLKCEMYELEIKWSKGKKCKDFLHEISPTSWKKEYEKLLKNEINEIDEDNRKVILSASLESLLGPFLKDTSVIQPKLYFTKPWEIRYVFRDMELKNQKASLFLEDLRKPNDLGVAFLHTTNEYYERETKKIEQNLTDLEKFILEEEKQAKALKEKADKLINVTFKKIICDKKSNLLHSHVQNAYELCIAPDGSKLSVLEMLKDLEIEYKRLLLELDHLPLECVKEAKIFVKEKTAYEIGQAKDARKKINYLDILIRRMVRALEPPHEKITRQLVFRSEPPPIVIKPTPPPKEMTSEELEYIHFFTDKSIDEIIDESKLFFPLGY